MKGLAAYKAISNVTKHPSVLNECVTVLQDKLLAAESGRLDKLQAFRNEVSGDVFARFVWRVYSANWISLGTYYPRSGWATSLDAIVSSSG